jgi:parvulin-like peptidyl-prolyl isomerase
MLRGVWRSLLQFAVLGAALFAADRLWWRATPEVVVIPAARAAEVDEELLYRAALARGYERDDPVVFRRLVQNLRFAGADEARDDTALFDEALALRMHESDPVVRRRLIQRMRLALEAEAPSVDPDEAALRDYYQRNAANYHSVARVRLTQLYFRGEREREARRAVERLRADATPPARALRLGDPFLHGAEQPLQTSDELAGRFGASFAEGVFAAPAGAWSGPIRSAYGVHLVFVHEREEPRALELEEVRDSLRHAVIAERRRAALDQGLAALRNGVRVVIEAPARPTP